MFFSMGLKSVVRVYMVVMLIMLVLMKCIWFFYNLLVKFDRVILVVCGVMVVR